MIRRKNVYSEYLAPENCPVASAELESRGCLLLKSAFTAQDVEALKADISKVFDEYPADGRSEKRSHKEDNMFRYEMLNRSALCQKAIASRRILDVIEPLIGEDCHVIANTAWRNEAHFKGSHGGGGWHIDAGPHIVMPAGVEWPANIPHPVFAIGVHIFLQDCGHDDGPTGVLPGSHLSGIHPPNDRRLDSSLTYKGAEVVPLIAKAGDVAMFVSDVWHRRMPTGPDDSGRFFLQVHYGRRDIAQRIRSTQVVNHLSSDAVHRAQSSREKSLIGLHPNLFYDG